MQKKLTITIHEEIYDGLHRLIGRGKISQFIEALVRPHVSNPELDSEYRKMAKDKRREDEAFDWAEETIGDIENVSR